MAQFDTEFDDPALKQAIRRAVGIQTAPPELRGRIEQMLDRQYRAQQREQSGRSWRRPVLGSLAAAAVLLIGLGLAYLLVWRTGPELPRFVADAMVVAHDQSVAGANESIKPNTDVMTIRQKLCDQVGHPVLVAMLGDHWKFEGADISQVSNVPSAHLLFRRGDQTLSIFSISAAAIYATNMPDGTNYEQVSNGHMISGFVSGGAVHCLVGYSKSGDLSLRDVTRLREQIRHQLAFVSSPFSVAPFCNHQP